MSTTEDDLLDDYAESEKEEQQEPEGVQSLIKNLLLERELSNGKSIFVHLTECIKKVLQERPNNATDVFEDISRQVLHEESTVKSSSDHVIDMGLAKIEVLLFPKNEGEEEEMIVEDEGGSPLPPLHLISFFYEQSGVGLSRQETFRVWMALKVLVNTQPIQKARFWGKILGIEKDYYVAEVDLREGEELEEGEEEEDQVDEDKAGDGDKDLDEEGDEEEEDKPPQSKWKPPPTVPKEEFRTGSNRHLYFVCSTLGSTWTRLPHVTPAQIKAARMCTRFFTGNLDAIVRGGPPFPGLEINMLRAQIARISAGTQISPLGFYTMDNEEEEELEEGAEPEEALENPEYNPSRPRELLERSRWVHYSRHILPQGRCSWWDPNEKADDELEADDDEALEEEDGGQQAALPERGPSLLTSISEDVALNGLTPWSLKLASKRIPEYSVVLASSNLWPGAHAFSFGKHFENLYIGWGFKSIQKNFCPDLPPIQMQEFPESKEITETLDPTVEEEAALKAKNATGEEGEEEIEEEEDN